MENMNARTAGILLANVVLGVGLLALVGFGKISWTECLVGLGLVLTPSAGSLLGGSAK